MDEINLNTYQYEVRQLEAEWWYKMSTKLVNAKEYDEEFDRIDKQMTERIEWLKSEQDESKS